jgi:hypothetical protein
MALRGRAANIPSVIREMAVSLCTLRLNESYSFVVLGMASRQIVVNDMYLIEN